MKPWQAEREETRALVRGVLKVLLALLAMGLLIAAVLMSGCATNDKQINQDRREDSRQGMANGKRQMAKAATAVKPMAAVATGRTVTLGWDPYTETNAHLMLEESGDLVTWAVVTNMPWWVSNVTVAATGPCGFYRLGADWN